ncbi:putative membrane protein [Roseinatronobacter thiooxidans]|uniref:Putative membrane protein n=1 Tax=Roseinatronobacter thiooxidans TaxID=121821 RepID=A0A2W7PUZ5_9RHOB|nr:DUF2254 family protein [Roseinatronobacter thiooxidans]PZX39313.1 putative membrane protein [Roseinatronobacter thiooxidans]
MHNFIFRWIATLRQNYWFLPSTMTFGAVFLGILIPVIDTWLGSDWIQAVGFIRATGVDGARAILTTLAGATLGVAGVAFSVTIVAVSFASSNYGPRLIGNFMADRTNQIILGVFVATFVYCITVLSTVHSSTETSDTTFDAFVPHISVYVALLFTLAAVGALIIYIHHIPESINIMNLTAGIGNKLHRAIVRMLEEEDQLGRHTQDASIEPWRENPQFKDELTIYAKTAGFIQEFDIEDLSDFARKHCVQFILHRAPGDFLVAGEPVLSARHARSGDKSVSNYMRDCYTQGANRTDVQDILFLSDQLVEVLGRALSSGVNDPQSAILCLNWLRAGLVAFVQRAPVQQAGTHDPVLYRRVSFEDILDRSFDEMRQYVAADRTATLHALNVLKALASAASRQEMVDACVRQMQQLARSANELLAETAAREEIETELDKMLREIESREG